MSFSSYEIDRRASKNDFFKKINKLINWSVIERDLKEVMSSGKKSRGQKAYNPLLLFKMQLVGIWYNLSDVQVEATCADSLSVMRFCGLVLEDSVPDHSTLSRFRTELTEKDFYDKLLSKIHEQLAKKGVIVKDGLKVDASLTVSPFTPKGRPTYELAEDRREDSRSSCDLDKERAYHRHKKVLQPGADNEARWVKKGGKCVYGYKKHIGVDSNGLVLGVHTTAANEHDSKGLEPLIKKTPASCRRKVEADKGYKSRDNDRKLKENGSKSRIMHKAYRNKPLSYWQKVYNKGISRTRWVVERTFGSLKRWFGAGTTRLKGRAKVHSLHVLEAIAYNLKRTPGLVCQ